MVSCSAVMRITARMQASFMRTQIPRPRMRMRTSALTYALGCQKDKNIREQRPCLLAKNISFRKVLVETSVVWTIERSEYEKQSER